MHFDGPTPPDSRRSEASADATAGDDLALGVIAVRKKLLDPSALQECLKEQQEARRAGNALSLGQILVRRGLVSAEGLGSLLEEQGRVRDILPNLQRYEIRERLGEGATAYVYRAWDRQLKRAVALKVLRESAGMSPIARERFRREAETAAALTHPNIIQIYDAGESSGQLYIVMELVDGKPLSALLSERTVENKEILKLLEKTARGVAAAHERGIVHRDLKPANVLVAASGEPKVGDFGLAHLLESPTQLTRTGAALGTPLYMSPEQVEGRHKEIDPRTDVYALGAILYEVLTRRPPQLGETLAEIYGRIIREEPLAPRRIDPQIPRDLETIALKALEKDPVRRYRSAGAFAEDLGRFLMGEPIQARPPTTLERIWRKAVRSRVVLITAAAAIALGLLAGFFFSRRAPLPRSVLALERLEGDLRTHRAGQTASPKEGDILDTPEGWETGPPPSRAVFRLEDGARLEVGPNTSVLDVRLSQEKELFISKGTLRLESPTPRMNRLRIRTPHADAHGWARNLGLSVDMDPMTGTFVEVRDGEIQLSDRKGNTVSLKTGEGATVATREALVAKPLSPVLELGEGVRLELVQIRAGSFTMGSGVAPGPEWQVDERPEHKVTISRGYYLGKYHVTREQFAAFVKATGYRTEAEKEGKAWGLQANGSWAAVAGLAWQNPGFPQTKDDPVTCVSWSDAKEFCDWATKRTGRPVRLPTEAEWEYACRAGTKTKWSWGDDVGAAVEYAWLDKNSGRMTHPVGQKKPNPWGLGDMHGHVWEWCQDWGGPYAATDAVDPTGPVSGDRRILRGGDWYLDARYARSAFRNHAGPSFRDTHVGFRVAVP